MYETLIYPRLNIASQIYLELRTAIVIEFAFHWNYFPARLVRLNVETGPKLKTETKLMDGDVSFLKKLFGMSSDATGGDRGADSGGAAVEHEGYMIVATPIKEGGQFRLSASISKEIAGEQKQHTLIRADIFPSKDECEKFAITKAKQVIKEQGDRMFE